MGYKWSFLLIGFVIYVCTVQQSWAKKPDIQEGKKYSEVISACLDGLFDNAVELENNGYRVEVLPEAGGRIFFFGLNDDENLFWTNEKRKIALAYAEENWINWGGSRIWPTVQSLWGKVYGGPRPHIDRHTWAVTQQEDASVTIESAVSPQLDITVSRKISPGAEGHALVVENSIERVSPNPFPVTIWSIAQLPHPDYCLLGVSPESPDAEKDFVNLGGPELETARKLEDIPAVGFDPGGYDGGAKIGTLGSWTAAIYEDYVLVMRADYDPEGAYPDGASAEIYRNPKLIELEMLSPFVQLKAGEKVENEVRWDVLKRKEGESIRSIAKRIVEKAGD